MVGAAAADSGMECDRERGGLRWFSAEMGWRSVKKRRRERTEEAIRIMVLKLLLSHSNHAVIIELVAFRNS